MNRRTFLLGAGALPLLAAPSRLRTISYNVLACGGYPKNAANTWRFEAAAPQMLTRYALELGLYRPDIVSFSESVLRPDAEKIARDLGFRLAYFEPGVPSFKGYPIGFPGTVFTHHEILESENCPYASGRTRDPELFTRHWGRALLKTNDEEIAFFSAHLNPHKQEIRLREIEDILLVMGPHLKSGRSVLFHCDLNHRPDTPEYQRWIDAGLTDALAVKGTGEQLFTVNSIRPRGRIDYIWAAGPLAKRLKECRVLFEGAFRNNPEDPTSFALSDHLPVLADFE
jgi:endonuclease/exonuclease/phosphatase family metal-dependent hydrolase